VKFWIGTSGFQYAEWKGNFYPEDLPAAKMLPFYAERLSTTEINYTFHRIPAAKTIDNWKQLTPEHFRFALKAPQKITHFAKLRDCADTLRYFNDVVSGLGEKLGPVLFQLPPNFRKDTFVLGDFVNGLPGGMRAAFEFRHESWFDDEVFETLKAREAALCIADTEKLETPKIATANYGYILRSTSNAGWNSFGSSTVAGTTFSSTSNMKKPGLARNWPPRWWNCSLSRPKPFVRNRPGRAICR